MQELRRAHIPFPDAFDREKYALEANIITKLLNHKSGAVLRE